MSVRTFIIATLGGVVAWLCFFAAAGVLLAHAGTTSRAPAKLAPPISCTSANRMDIFVDEDNILWACECEMLKTGNICRWQVIGGVDPVDSRKRVKRPHAKGWHLAAPALSRVPA